MATRRDAKKALQKAGVGSKVRKNGNRRHGGEEGTITSFDGDGDPVVKYSNGDEDAEFANHVTLVKTVGNSFSKGDKVIKRTLIGTSTSEWSIGTKGTIQTGISGGYCKVLNSYGEQRNCEMRHWELDEQATRVIQIGGDLPARAGNIPIASKKTNDGRTNCYSCGALTRVIDTGHPGSCMKVCTKCEL